MFNGSDCVLLRVSHSTPAPLNPVSRWCPFRLGVARKGVDAVMDLPVDREATSARGWKSKREDIHVPERSLLRRGGTRPEHDCRPSHPRRGGAARCLLGDLGKARSGRICAFGTLKCIFSVSARLPDLFTEQGHVHRRYPRNKLLHVPPLNIYKYNYLVHHAHPHSKPNPLQTIKKLIR